MDDNPEVCDRLNVNKSTYHNKRPRERFICFIRGAKWMKINQLNGPSPIHDTSTRLSQSIQFIRHVCCWLGMQKNSRVGESASEQLSTITISRQQLLPSKLDAWANVTTCWWDKHGCGNSNTNHGEMLETEKETQIEYEINFYFKKGIQLLRFQAEDWLHLRRS